MDTRTDQWRRTLHPCWTPPAISVLERRPAAFFERRSFAIEDPPIIEDEQEERDEDIPQPKPPRFRPPPRSQLTTDKLHIVSLNADGIQRKIEELENYINDNSPDIIALQETNLRPCIDLNIPKYSTHRNDRLTHRGGGTAILVKNSIAHHVINIYTTVVNITAIEIEGPTNNITVCSLYRSPSSPINSFYPDLIKIFRNRAQCIIVGDYNARHSTWNPNRRGNTAGARLFHYANTCGLVISAPTDPTRIPQQQNHQPSVIDLGVSCGINNIAVESRYDVSSDHNPVHFVVKFNFKTSHL
ncbi:RNA-directed DNA polymerase from mobile element jockey [Trichonephila clavipes]|nr:RNA-directed DNA polymerase from mobile element jockey [Trichonephila clavipes]